jgi:cell division protein FtsL
MTVKQFVDKYTGQKVDFDGHYGGQCFDLYRQYVADVLRHAQAYPAPAKPELGRGAADLWTGFNTTPQLRDNYTKITNTADFVPIEGDVMIWNRRAGGGHGHVAIVVGDDHTLDYFHSLDQNWSKLSFTEIVKHDYKNVYGVLRPNVLSKPDPMPEKTYTEEQMTEVRLERDRNWMLYQAEKEKSDNLKSQIDFLNDEVSRLGGENDGYKAQVKKLRSTYDSFVSDLVKALGIVKGTDSEIDASDVIAKVEELLGIEDQLSKLKKDYIQLEKKSALERDELKIEMDKLRSEIAAQQKQNEQLLSRIDDLESRLESSEQIVELSTRFSTVVENILSIFKRKK